MRAYEFISEGNDQEHHTGGSLGLPFPGTYEQEYDMFKTKGPRRITAMTNEALDSSYPFDADKIKGRYRFKTEKGLLYVVYFQGDDLVEVSFSVVMPGDDDEYREKTSLTGTGDSRKVLGTVVEIIRDYLTKYSPKALHFTADSDEPSRVKLYNTMISQVDKALPNYYSSGTVDLGSGTAYMLHRKKAEVTNEVNDDKAKNTKKA